MKSLAKKLLLIPIGFLAIKAQGQELSRHEWKHRVLLVLTSDTLAPDYQEQMESIFSDKEGLDERKLIIYRILPSGYQELNANGKWIPSPELYKSFHQSGNTLEVVLIGLDGRVKHRNETMTPLAQVYSWIDAMPMRREELRRKQAEGNKD
jgi:hypothetical protein